MPKLSQLFGKYNQRLEKSGTQGPVLWTWDLTPSPGGFADLELTHSYLKNQKCSTYPWSLPLKRSWNIVPCVESWLSSKKKQELGKGKGSILVHNSKIDGLTDVRMKTNSFPKPISQSPDWFRISRAWTAISSEEGKVMLWQIIIRIRKIRPQDNYELKFKCQSHFHHSITISSHVLAQTEVNPLQVKRRHTCVGS